MKMTALGDKVRGSKANNNSSNDAGNQQRPSKNGRWGSGPPQFSRQSKGSPSASSDNSPSRSSPVAAGGATSTRSFSAVTASGASGSTSNSGVKNSSAGTHTRPQGRSSAANVTLRGLIEGEEPEQVEEMNRRMLYLLSYLVGSPIKVVTKTNEAYIGILDSINPNDAQSVVLRYAYIQADSKSKPPIDTLVIHGSDCLHINGIVSFAEGSQRDSSRVGFKTDTDISWTGSSVQGSGRALHRWVPDEDAIHDPLVESLDPTGSSLKSWDQFATNEQLFGLTTDFDEEIYTTKLDRSRPDFKEREREAIRIAQEIQNTPYLNPHVAEERQEIVIGDDGNMDEEDRYGAVLRPSGAPGKYVPPYLRGKMVDSSSVPAPAPAQAPAKIAPGKPTASAATKQAVTNSAPSVDAFTKDFTSQAPNASAGTPSATETSTARSSNAVAAAALAKLNIRTTSHQPVPGSDTVSAADIGPGSPKASVAAISSLSLATEPTAASLPKQPNIPANSKLANLRGLKQRTDVAALNKPMADITEKLNSERERIHQHKQALLKNRMSELVKFHKSFKLNTPMPEDVAEIIGAKKKSPGQGSESNASTTSGNAASESSTEESNGTPAAAVASPKPTSKDAAAKKPTQTVDSVPKTAVQTSTKPTKPNMDKLSEANDKEEIDVVDSSAKPTKKLTTDKTADEPKTEDKKPAFKFNTKASSFKPNVSATGLVPKFSASSSRASSAAGVVEFNPFFGRRILKKARISLWDGAFKLTEYSATGDHTPTWPFGSRTYRSQFVAEEPDVMMYQSQGGYMQQYGYGYYNPYQYPPHPPPQMAMMPPGMAPRMAATSPYSAAAYGGNGPIYASGSYSSAPAYPSPIMVGAGCSPVIAAMNGPSPPATHPLSHAQGANISGAVSGNTHITTTPEIATDTLPGQVPQTQPPLPQQQQQTPSSVHAGRSGSGSPSVMYGTPPVPPVHMGIVPPPMPHFSGMQHSGYMGPMPPASHQGYPQQSISMPIGYTHYPPAQAYGASPPGMVMMHGSPHPDQGAPGNHHHPSY
ncbi:poly(A)-binding protein binding protein [Coemansia sp. RSA 1358]|nr:poly(A)-binding protein binding protein [Coemansia sp. RSA 1358]